MASKHFEGTLVEPIGVGASNDKLRFTHTSTTGQTIGGAQSVVKIAFNGDYSFDLEYGIIQVEYYSETANRWRIAGSVIVNSDTTATTITGLLNAMTPTTPAIVLELQQILADAEQAVLDTQQSASEAAQSAIESAASAVLSAENAAENGEVIKSLLIAQGLSGNYGFFADGFTYNLVGDVGIDTDGKIYTYAGSDQLPVSVAAGTDPVGDSDYYLVKLNSAENIDIKDSNGESVKLQSLTDPEKAPSIIAVAPFGILKYSTRRLHVQNFVADRNNPDYRAAITAMLDQYENGYRKFDFGDEELSIGSISNHYGSIFRMNQVDGVDIRHSGILLVENNIIDYNNFESVLQLNDPRYCQIELNVKGDVYDPLDAKGVAGLMLWSELRDGYDLDLNISCTNGLAAIQSNNEWRLEDRPRLPTDPNIRRFNFKSTCNTGKYGARFIDTGQDFKGEINTSFAGRSASMVGVENGILEINSASQGVVADVMLKCYRNDVRNMNITLNQRDALNSNYWPLQLEHQNDEQDTTIENIVANINIHNRQSQNPNGRSSAVIGRSLTRSGSENQTTNCVTDNITVNLQYNGYNDFPAPTLRFPTFPNSGGLIETNVMNRGFTTNGFTLKTGRTYRASTVLDPSDNPVKINFGKEFEVPSYAVLKITNQGVENRSSLSLGVSDITTGYYHAVFRSTAPEGTVTLLGTELINVNNSTYNFSMKTEVNKPVLVVESTRIDTSLNGMFSVTVELETGSRFTG